MFDWKKNKEGQSRITDYRIFFILGISFVPLGVIYEIVFFISDKKAFLALGIAFIGIGISYLAISLSKRDKWKKQ